MSYKLGLHVLATLTEQVVPIYKHITFFLNSFDIRNQSHVSRPPYPQLRGQPHCHRGPKIQSLNPHTKFQLPRFKYETLEISDVFHQSVSFYVL